MDDVLTILFAAVLVEGLVTIVRNIKEKESDWRYWLALGVSMILSILVSYNWELDLFSVVLGEGQVPLIGIVLTGLVISRGSNYVADLLKLLGATTNRIRNGI